MSGFLTDGDRVHCFGCEACASICPKNAIAMQEDAEGFRYPRVDAAACIHCGRCHAACPQEQMPARSKRPLFTWGGYIKDAAVREASTSGGAFTALADWALAQDTIVYGAVASGLDAHHAGTRTDVGPFRKSKYTQSKIGATYREILAHLRAGERVLFSGTPCQVAGLQAFLGAQKCATDHLLTVEVVCEGVPSPLYIRKFVAHLLEKHRGASSGDSRARCAACKDGRRWDFQNMEIEIDYRCKDGRRWDYEVMEAKAQPIRFHWKCDRWFNPFWSIWLRHLMSRPSCYACPFACVPRTADVTLGDLWGVHLYCPELYGENGGASLVLCHTEKGRRAWQEVLDAGVMYGHALRFEDALRYQGPIRNHIQPNPDRDAFMKDLQSMEYAPLIKKWARRPSLRLLISKYVWGTNRQKVFWALLKRRLAAGWRKKEG